MDIEKLNSEFAELTYTQRFEKALELFGDRLYLMTSAGRDSAVVQHIAREALGDRMPPTLFIDTGFYGCPTYEHLKYLERELCKGIIVYKPLGDCSGEHQEWESIQQEWNAISEESKNGVSKNELAQRIEKLEKRYDEFRYQNKGEPTQRAIEELGIAALVRGLRRDQSLERASTQFIAEGKSLYSVAPIADMGYLELLSYLQRHNLRQNPHHADIMKGLDLKSECPLVWVI